MTSAGPAEPPPSPEEDRDDADAPSRRRRGERTAQRLRAAARRAFSLHGYAAARVEDVVAEAGVSHGTFYTYYDNKAAILDALVDETAEALLAVVAERWDGPDVEAAVQGVIARFVEVFGEYVDVIRAWLEASAHERHFRDRMREVRDGYVERVAEQLRPVVAGTGHDARIAAGALVAMVEGYATQGMASDDDDHRRSAVRTLAALWFGGLQRLTVPPATPPAPAPPHAV